ncbi:tRNA (guanine37-N1)-methyltransferase [Amycolatopsis marina]|uniref:tRNA (guanine-N(1)-)-methyltransferase n=1 Tax=Amycolatopsis marina TaxID=490629 RepID=A0A1I0WNF9_9PSEU|nr:tRNA (guanosine(37)-N1)-methyltransferase TrmD [Amycolatopsis marina]SFA90074.1 tRNA (guanine37-N1)-methyltransferase [Amycolatopsis marina]
MRIDVVTIFPEYLDPLRAALLGRAIDRGLIEVGVHDLRGWTHDVHRAVDDAPYGGGPGMVMKPQIWGAALDDVCAEGSRLVVPTPAGRPFDQALAHAYAEEEHLVFACGRYEGIDQRVIDDAARRMPVDEVSIGDYVLVGGEAAVLVMVEAVVRLLPGVLGNPASAEQDSFSAFSGGLLEGPSYTRPEVWRDMAVPDVLRSGNHALIDRWRRDESLERTALRRPDLIAALPEDSLDAHDRAVLERLRDQPERTP